MCEDNVADRGGRAREEHEDRADARDEKTTAREPFSTEDIVEPARDKRDCGVDKSSGQHEQAGDDNREPQSVLGELRKQIHGGKGDAEVDHDEHGGDAELTDTECAKVEDGAIACELTTNVEREGYDADDKRADDTWRGPAEKTREAETEHDAAETQAREHARDAVDGGTGEFVGAHEVACAEVERDGKHDGEDEKEDAPREKAQDDARKRGADGRGEHDDERHETHGAADFGLGEYFEHHCEHHGKHKAGADALDEAADECDRKARCKAAYERAYKERSEREQGE